MFKKLSCFVMAYLLSFSSLYAEATFSRIKNWDDGEILFSSDLNPEFDNIINNLDPSGVGDYSATVTQMRSTADPYPGSAESQPTSLAGELERIRYQILYLKKAMQASSATYWYEDPPTQGALTIDSVNKYIGINDTTPNAYISIDNSGDNAPSAIAMHGGSNNRYWINASTITNALLIGQGASASTVPEGSDYAIKINNDNSVTFSTNTISIPATNAGISKFSGYVDTDVSFSGVTIIPFTEEVDTLGEFTTSSFTATSAGYYLISASLSVNNPSGTPNITLAIYKNGSVAYRYEHQAPSANWEQVITFGNLMSLSASDVISIRASTNSGTQKVLGINQGGAGAGSGGSNLSIYRVF